MKRFLKKTFAIVLSLAMIMTNGMGVVAFAADGSEAVDPHVLNIQIQDENGSAVSGVKLMLENEYGVKVNIPDASDASGNISYNVASNYNLADDFTLKSASSNFEMTEEPVITFDVDSSWNTVIAAVDDEDYTGKVVVKGTVSGAAAADPVISTVEGPEALDKSASSVQVTVKGENLPDTFNCKIVANFKDGDDTISTSGSYKNVTATGTATERVITLDTPYCANPVSWTVTVRLTDYTQKKEITIPVGTVTEPEEPSTEPVIEGVEFPETADKAASSIEVKVTGKNLPETLNCRIKANYDDGFGQTAQTNGSYADVETTGTASERIITLSTPYCANPISWTIDVRLPQDYNFAQKQTGTVTAVTNTPVEPEVTVDKFVLALEVKDADNAPVQGLSFVLKKGSQSIVIPGTTDAEGKLSYNVASNYSLYGDYTLKLAPYSGYLLAAEPTISIGMDADHGYDTCIDAVDGEAYTGSIALTASVDENAEPAPVVQGIEAPATLTKDATSVQIKVIGENLPTTFNCKFVANFDDGFGGTMPTTGSWSDVEATGTATERIITLSTPYCANPLSWDVSVRLADKTQTKTAHIELGAAPTEPEFDTKLLQVKAVTEDGTAVSGLSFCVVNHYNVKSGTIGTTDAKGEFCYDMSDDPYFMDSATLKLVDGSGYELVAEPVLTIGEDDDMYGFIEEVDGNAYTAPITVIVKKAEASAEPVIESLDMPATVEKTASSIQFKVIGENLPTTFNCRIKANYDDGFGQTAQTNGSYADVEATGTATERVITLETPYCANPVSWTIDVRLPSDYNFAQKKTVTVNAKVETPEEPTVNKGLLEFVVVDADGKPVANETVYLIPDDEYNDEHEFTTDADGAISIDLFDELVMKDTYTLALDEDSDYELDGDVTVVIGDCDQCGGGKPGVVSVNGEEYTGSFQVKVKDAVVTPVEPVKFKLLQNEYSAYRGATNNVVVIDCTKYEKALAFADVENIKDYFYFSWSTSSNGTEEGDLTLGADDTITIENNVITITLADEKASTPGFVFIKPGALVNEDGAVLGTGEFGAKNYKYIIAGAHISSISYNQITFDHNGGHVVATVTGTNLNATALAAAKIFLDNAAAPSEIKPVITVESATKATIEWDVAANTSENTVTYRMLPVINGVTVAPQQMEGYDIIAVLPEGKTTDAVTLSSLEVTGSNDKNDAIDAYETEITSADFTAKVELIIRGSNLDGKLAAIKAVDENGVEWPTLPVHECGATVRWQSSANYIAESQSINEKRIELLPPRHLYTSHTFKIYVAPDGVNFDEHVYATITINNNGIYDPADGFTPEQLSVLKDVTVKYVDEKGNDIIPAETRKGYGITELYTLALGVKEFAGYEYVSSTPSNIDSLIEPPRLTESGDYVFDGGQFFVKHLEKNNLQVVHTYKTLETPDFTYTVADGACTITGLTEQGQAKLVERNGALEIPAELDGAAVTAIGMQAFMNNTDIKSVTFPASVTTIGQQAFQGTGLTAVVLPDTVTTLGLGAFNLCAGLADITISKNIETIPQNAFAQTAVKNVVIPEGVKTIGRMAFNGAPVENLTIATTVELIDQQAFQNNNLTSVEIPANVKTIGNYAFRVIANNGPMTTVTLNEGLESIGNGAFAGQNLTEVAVPASLKTLHYNAFTGNQNGKVAVISTVADQRAAAGAYTGIGVANAKATFYMPAIITLDAKGGTVSAETILTDEAGKVALPTPAKFGFEFLGWFTAENEAVTEDTVFTADATLHAEYEDLSAFTFTVADGACTITGLTTKGQKILAENNGALEIPAEIDGVTVTAIGQQAFMNNTDIKSVTFPASVTTIGQQAFQGTGLTAVVLPDTVTTLGLGAFNLCTGLADITISKNIETIPQNAFAQTAVKNVVIPEGVKTIGRMAFNGAPVENLTIATTVELIDQQAFQNNNLTSVEIPANVKTIGNYAFRVIANNGPMTTVTLNEGLESIGNGAFAGQNLTEVAVPASLKTLHYNAFTGNQPGKVRVLSTVSDQKTATGEYTGIGVANAKATFYMPWMVEFDLAGGEMDEPTVVFVDEENKIELPTPSRKGFTFEGWFIDEETQADADTVYTADTKLVAAWEEPDLTRYAGGTRYETALLVADALKEAQGVESFNTIIVANGENYPDALTGGYLAKVTGAPMLLVGSKSEAQIAEYISQNLTKDGKVYILGGTGAVSTSFEKKAKAITSDVVRIGGATRYETNMNILKEAGVNAGYNGELIICSGNGYADSLSASAAGKPILLVGTSLTAAQKSYIKTINPSKFYVIGGTSAVSKTVEKALGSNAVRVAGATRYETSARVAETFFSQGAVKAVFSYAQNFPDGLAGSALAMQLGAPLILTDNSAKGVAAAKAYAEKAGVQKSVILGGDKLISDASIEKILK